MQNLIDCVAGKLPSAVGEHDKQVNKNIESGLAADFADICAREGFRTGNGYIMGYDGWTYRLLDDKIMESIIVQSLRKVGTGLVYVVNSVPQIRKMVERVGIRQYRPRKNIVAFNNWILDLDTGNTYEHGPQWETDIRIGYDYDKSAECPKFMKYLYEVLQEEDTIRTLQEFCGALFIDRRRYKIENILYLLGGGQNGKGVFTSILTNMLGAQNITSFSVDRLTRASNKEYNIAAMNGKLANVCNDMSKGDVSGGEFKTIVSGEPIMARFPYGRAFNADNLPLIIANVNEMPVTTDHTLGHSRRPLPIPFRVTITDEKKDLELESKLREEVSGVFNWIYEGRKRFISQNGKFTEGAEIRKEREKIRIESNSLLQFFEEEQYSSIESDGAEEIWLANKDIFEKYIIYCRNNGNPNAFKGLTISRMMSAEGYIPKRKTNDRGWVIWKGGKQWMEPEVEEEEPEEDDKARIEKELPF